MALATPGQSARRPVLVLLALLLAVDFGGPDYARASDLAQEADLFRPSRVKRSSKQKVSEGALTSADWSHIMFCAFAIAGFLLMLLQLYATLLGRRMRNDGVRFHTFVVVYVDVDEQSPWRDFMRNAFLTNHGKAVQWMTMTVFQTSVTLMVPVYLLSYFFTALRKTFLFKWMVWFVVYGILVAIYAVLGLLFFKSVRSDSPEEPTGSYLEAYQFYICVASYITIGYLFVAWVISFSSTACFVTVNCVNLHAGTLAEKTTDLINLFAFWLNLVIMTVFTGGPNTLNGMNYITKDVMPTVLEAVESADGSSDASSSFDVSSLMKYADKLELVLKFMQSSEMYVPVVFFACNAALVPMYRETLVQLLTCGACYRSDKEGSVWGLIPDRFRNIYPLEMLRWANPALLAQGFAPPPPPPGYDGQQRGPLALLTSNDKKELMVEQLE